MYCFATKIDISLSPPFYVSRDTGWEWCAHAPKLWQDFYSIYGVYLAQREGLTFCCCCQKFPLGLLLLFLLPDLVWLAIFIMLQLGDKQKQLNNQPMHTRTDGVSAIAMSALSARCLSACLAVRPSFTYKAEYVHTCVRM